MRGKPGAIKNDNLYKRLGRDPTHLGAPQIGDLWLLVGLELRRCTCPAKFRQRWRYCIREQHACLYESSIRRSKRQTGKGFEVFDNLTITSASLAPLYQAL